MAVASVDRPDPSVILMTAVSGMADKSDFKIALKRDPSMDLAEFYHEAEKFLQQEDAGADKDEVMLWMAEDRPRQDPVKIKKKNGRWL